MIFDIDKIRAFYRELPKKIKEIKRHFSHPLTFTEKVLYTHLYNKLDSFQRGISYANFLPDRVAMQDATAQMVILQFMQAGKQKVEVPSTIHCDHLILAEKGAKEDLRNSLKANKEVFDFLSSTSSKYGIGFWKPGAGIIHQVVLENYAFPGGMMVGTDSHTPNAGGLGMVAIGVGGADAVDVMVGMPWELKFPKIIGIHLTGELNGWTSAKDVILTVAGILTVKGGTNAIIEYLEKEQKKISCTGKATICNMGAEIGATTSLFAYDESMRDYLNATNREEIALLADKNKESLKADSEVYAKPDKYFDRVIEINLSELEPYVNGPFSPDKAWKISQLGEAVKKNNYPKKIEVGLIGSCTNSSYEDITRAASVAEQAIEKKLKVKTQLTVTPGSEMVRFTAQRDGLLQSFEKIGGVVLANACGPCIGQWARHTDNPEKKNSIITSFNRNFSKRNDGNPNTHSFVASPEIVTAMTIAGDLTFNPLKDKLINEEGKEVSLTAPKGLVAPVKGYEVKEKGYLAPAEGEEIEVSISPDSQRLQLLTPFEAWEGTDLKNLKLLLKVKGKCTTDHISMAGPWLRFRGHLDNISDNCFIGAINTFNEKANSIKNQLTNTYQKVPETARAYKKASIGSVVVGDENYGEGSSREHAAMEPRHLGVRVIVVRSFARIHETNLKKQGVLALTFDNPKDYDKILEDDEISIIGMKNFEPKKHLQMILHHKNNTKEEIIVNHSYNKIQIEWFKAGSALNKIKNNNI